MWAIDLFSGTAIRPLDFNYARYDRTRPHIAFSGEATVFPGLLCADNLCRV